MKNMRCIIFGVGKYWSFAEHLLTEEVEIIAFMDNKEGGINDICSPRDWRKLEFDKILICVANFHEKVRIMNQLIDLGVAKSKIGFIEEFRKCYCTERIEVVEKNVVNIYTNDIVIRCENEIEYMIAEEILIGEEYGFHSNENYFVIDIGMNIGCASLYFALKENVTAVYGFEPCKDVYDKAVQNIERNKNNKKINQKINAFNIGLGGKNGKEYYIEHGGISKSGGIKKIQDGVDTNESIIELDVKQASTILTEIFSKHREKCLIKMDCEGAEYEILEDLIATGQIEKIDVIIMEWHVGKYILLEQLLEKAGFKYLLNKGRNDYGKCFAWK